MKLFLAILLISFLSIEAHGSRVKRGFSEDELKEFMEELNYDRKKVAKEEGLEYVPMKYDASLVKRIVPGESCWNDVENRGKLLPLRYNDVAEKLRKHHTNGPTGEGDPFRYYCNPRFDKIGCSKEAKCKEEVLRGPSELVGKLIEFHGICVVGRSHPSLKEKESLHKGKIQPLDVYADILGIPKIKEGSGMGKKGSGVEIPGTKGAEGEQGSGVEGSGMDGTNGKQGSGVEMSGKTGADGEQGSGAGSIFSLTISLLLVLYI
ncbi:unnamed protein product [Caenorhabditis brenneri]